MMKIECDDLPVDQRREFLDQAGALHSEHTSRKIQRLLEPLRACACCAATYLNGHCTDCYGSHAVEWERICGYPLPNLRTG